MRYAITQHVIKYIVEQRPTPQTPRPPRCANYRRWSFVSGRAGFAAVVSAMAPGLLISPPPAAAQAPAPAAPSAYRILDMGLMAGTYANEPQAVNAAGQVAGNTTRTVNKATRPSHGYLWENGAFHALPPAGAGDVCDVQALSDTGLAVGTSGTYGGSAPSVPVLWRRSAAGGAYAAADLNGLLPPGSGWTLRLASGISPNGRYVAGWGYYSPDGGARHAFVAELSPDRSFIIKVAALGNLGGYALNDGGTMRINGHANAVNDAGQVTGSSYTGQRIGTTYPARAFRVAPLDADGDGSPDTWFAPAAGAADPMQNALMEDLGTLGGESSVGVSINAAGKVAGGSDYLPGSGTANQGFLWSPGGAMSALGVLKTQTVAGSAPPMAYVFGLSDADVAVGWANRDAGPNHAFAWTPSGGLRDLNDLKAPGDAAYLELNWAQAVSSDGRIVGKATQWVRKNGYQRAFLAIPLPQ